MKKIISILVALGLVLAMSVMATPAMAATCLDDAVDNCAVTLVVPAVECETATYNITFTPHTLLAIGDMIVVDLPAGANATGCTASINGVAAAAPVVVADRQVRILTPVVLPAGVLAKLQIVGIDNPMPAGAKTLSIWTEWDTCPCSAAFTILVGGSISPTTAVWCPGSNITVDITWGGSTNISGVDGGVYLVDYTFSNVTNKLTILPVYMATVAGNTCSVVTLNIDFVPGCNVTLTVTIADNATVVLNNGWNLMSLPIIPISEDIEDVLAGVDANVVSVWYYDGCEDEWYAYKNGADFGLATMEAGKAYWVCMNATRTLSLCGYELPCPPGAPPCYCYCHCWNMVGFHSTTAMNLSAYLANLSPAGSLFGVLTWNASGWQNVNAGTTMNPGQGYWMAFTADQACFAPPA